MADEIKDGHDEEELEGAVLSAEEEDEQENPGGVVWISDQKIDRTYVTADGTIYAPSDVGNSHVPKALQDHLDHIAAAVVARPQAQAAAQTKRRVQRKP